ncbi:uncharacterized protein LOC143904690 [Temnothorax americanus]|uniref:uncharacterized protein LOC143904690 n=1 Tax=Temnothorax americanus TaxID=1964332 RepID=UPI0040681F8A
MLCNTATSKEHIIFVCEFPTRVTNEKMRKDRINNKRHCRSCSTTILSMTLTSLHQMRRYTHPYQRELCVPGKNWEFQLDHYFACCTLDSSIPYFVTHTGLINDVALTNLENKQ